MVLHNSKWNRKASSLYRKKHGLAKDGAPKSVENKPLPETVPDPEPIETRVANSHSESEETDDGDTNGASSNSAAEDELPSNSWRYEDPGDYGSVLQIITM